MRTYEVARDLTNFAAVCELHSVFPVTVLPIHSVMEGGVGESPPLPNQNIHKFWHVSVPLVPRQQRQLDAGLDASEQLPAHWHEIQSLRPGLGLYIEVRGWPQCGAKVSVQIDKTF